jgi:hypothetical protein
VNLGEVVDMNFGPDFSFQVQKGCIEACHLITVIENTKL